MPNFLKDFKCCLTTLLLLFFAKVLFAQPKDNSPYSLLGLGEISNPTLSAAGFGGLSAGYLDALHLNLLNPASLAWLSTATFEAGLYTEHATLQLGDTKSNTWTGNLSHIALGFPLHNTLNDVLDKKKRKLRWGMSLALLPYSQIGYDIETTSTYITEGDTTTTTNTFQGTGGTNKAVWGNAVRYKNFSAGLNLGLVFGQLESTRISEFPEIPNSYQDIFRDNIGIRGFVWSAGVQQLIPLEAKKKSDEGTYMGKALIVGAYGNSATSFNTNSTVLRMGFNPTLNHSDTSQYEENRKGDGKLPAEFTIGAMYQNPGKLRLGAEFNYGNWSNYENDAKPETLFNSHRIAVGAELIPDISSYNNYLKRVRYRAGLYYRTDPRLEDLKQYALTVGFGLPVILPRQQTSFVNFSFEFGRFDTDNAIKENFIKMGLGFTLNDSSWFFKRKFG